MRGGGLLGIWYLLKGGKDSVGTGAVRNIAPSFGEKEKRERVAVTVELCDIHSAQNAHWEERRKGSVIYCTLCPVSITSQWYGSSGNIFCFLLFFHQRRGGGWWGFPPITKEE